jgi:hypothetical protein
MSDYFKFFPSVIHSDRSVVDITRRTKILEDIANDPYVFLPYTVVQDDRPENIAEFYYGNANKVWLVYFANNIIDMYSQWPLSQDDFDKYIIKKYKEQANAESFAVISWTQNETIDENIMYYQNNNTPALKINKYTYDTDDSIVGGDWRAIRYYEHEFIINENKRNIYLIDSRFADKFENDLKVLINE